MQARKHKKIKDIAIIWQTLKKQSKTKSAPTKILAAESAKQAANQPAKQAAQSATNLAKEKSL